MADGAELSIDTAKLLAGGDRLVRRYLTSATLAVGGATRRLEKRLEDETRAQVPGRLWRAWVSQSYPKSGPAREPVGEVFVAGKERSRARGAMTFWTQPGAIRGREGQWLAIPLPAAGPRGRKRMLTPMEWELAHNIELEYVPRPGKWPLLVAQQGSLTRGGNVTQLSVKQARRNLGRPQRVSIPIFVLMPTVAFRNSIDVDAFVRQAGNDLVADFLARTRG